MLWLTLDLKTGVILETQELLGEDILITLNRVSYRKGEPHAIKIGIQAPQSVGIGRRSVEPLGG